jgi:hypothetical protein
MFQYWKEIDREEHPRRRVLRIHSSSPPPRDILTEADEYKERKYAELREQMETITGVKVNQAAIVVSSLGTVPKETQKALARLLRTKDSARLAKYYRRRTTRQQEW